MTAEERARFAFYQAINVAAHLAAAARLDQRSALKALQLSMHEQGGFAPITDPAILAFLGAIFADAPPTEDPAVDAFYQTTGKERR